MKRFLVRMWNIIPGLASWLTIITLFVLAFVSPATLTVLVLLYAIYWLIRVFIITGHLVAGYRKYTKEMKVDWLKRLKTDYLLQYRDYYHLVIIPTYKEDISILRSTINSFCVSNFPMDRVLVVVAFEERDKDNAIKYEKILTHEYGNRFGMFTTTLHPEGIPGEIKGKGPNITWAGRIIAERLKGEGIAYDRVIVTTLDADNRVNENYFANILWTYLSTPDPIHKSFQPLPMFFNNIWKVPLPVKITALSSSFWQIIQAMRPRYSRNFASHAQSMQALIETDFWSVKTVVEDGHQYWRSYFAFEGNHHVVPTFVPIYMDAVEGDNLMDSFDAQYQQRRRWYWGVSDVPYVFEHSYGNNKIPFFYKWLQFLRLAESHYSLATQPFILTLGWLPVIMDTSFGTSVMGYSFPIVYRYFLTAAWIGMIANMLTATLLVPPRPGSKLAYRMAILTEWILSPIVFPVIGICFSAFPAIDSQTRMMLNKPFTVFNVTKKSPIAGGILRVDAK